MVVSPFPSIKKWLFRVPGITAYFGYVQFRGVYWDGMMKSWKKNGFFKFKKKTVKKKKPPAKTNILNLKSPNWNGKTSEPSLHFLGFKILVFEGLNGFSQSSPSQPPSIEKPLQKSKSSTCFNCHVCQANGWQRKMESLKIFDWYSISGTNSQLKNCSQKKNGKNSWKKNGWISSAGAGFTKKPPWISIWKVHQFHLEKSTSRVFRPKNVVILGVFFKPKHHVSQTIKTKYHLHIPKILEQKVFINPLSFIRGSLYLAKL